MMRIDRGALFLALPLVLAAVPVAEARILGAGTPRTSDCYLVLEGITATSPSKPNAVTCRDGNPACDADTTPGQCTFTFTVCVAADDTNVAGCNPGSVTKVKPPRTAGTTVNYPILPASTPTCAAAPTSFVLRLRRNGRPTKLKIDFQARATGRPALDRDRLYLRCDPAPASPSGAFVMRGE